MRFIETKRLADYIVSTGSFLSDDITQGFTERLDSLNKISLQDFSVEHDTEFLQEISSVLNVIVSIIYHPHLSNKHEEVIIRTELAQQIGRDDFAETIRDSKLWKEHDARMIPEEVHYRLHIDELRIYENRFIGFLVDVIDKELLKFSNFYLAKLPTVDSAGYALERNQIGNVIVEIDRLRRKVQFIKGTYFYKEVSKGKPISRKIQPTNILLKDRLYRFCFKFYRNYSRYEDPEAATRDLRDYYTILLFKALRDRGFELKSQQNGKYNFENAEFSISVERWNDESLSITTTYSKLPSTPAKHLVLFSVESEPFSSFSEINGENEHDGTELLSAWELSFIDGGQLKPAMFDTETNLAAEIIASTMQTATADRAIYKKYCPVCRSRGITAFDNVYSCPKCTSSYMFSETDDGLNVWFRKIRK